MFNMQQILSALGNAIINSFWQMGLLWIALLLISKFGAQITPRKLSNFSFGAIVIGFISFLFTFAATLFFSKADLLNFRWITSTMLSSTFIDYCGIVYLFLLIFPLLRFFLGIKDVYSLERTGLDRVPGHIKLFVVDMCQYLHIKRKVKIFTSAMAKSPLTTGFLKPVILIPVALMNQLTTSEIEAIILHELAHIKRNDYLKNIITQIILSLLYFNPFARLLGNMSQAECEKSADKWVTQFEYNETMYAKLLLLLAKQNVAGANSLTIGVSGHNTPLLERIEWILGKEKRRVLPLKNIMVLLMLLAGSLLFTTHQNSDFTKATPVNHPSPAITYHVAFTSNKTPSHKKYQTENIVLTSVSLKAGVSKNRVNQTKHSKQQNEIEPSVNTSTIGFDAKPVFVAYSNIVIPQLNEAEESNIQNAISATKVLLKAYDLNTIDKALAETMTEENKLLMKQAYNEEVQKMDWSKQENSLRLHYNNIDWRQVNTKLQGMVNQIVLDSLYCHYKKITKELTARKNYLEQDSTSSQAHIAKISQDLNLFTQFLKNIDSLKAKKIIEL